MADISPQRVQLASSHFELSQQHGFDLCSVLGRLSQPGQDRIFLKSFGSRQAAEAIAFGQQSQRFEDLVLCRPLAKENGAGRGGKGVTATLALVALDPASGFAELANIRLVLIGLKPPIVGTGFVWTKITWLGKLFHLSPSDLFAISLP
jgi:hypothetical protein